MRNYPKFYITKKGERAARNGHPWVYGEEVTKTEGTYANGDLVDVVTEKGKYLGTGFVNDNSKIRVRIISTNTNDKFDEAFWERRLRYALDYRKTVMPGDDYNCCRLIFGEADQFPGWTVDRYNDLLVIQTLSLGMEQRKAMLISLLVKLLREDGETISGVYERNDVKIRLLEGMEEGKGWFPLGGESAPESAVTTICENGIYYDVDVENGQKTGFFLDQKYNRLNVARIPPGAGLFYPYGKLCPERGQRRRGPCDGSGCKRGGLPDDSPECKEKWRSGPYGRGAGGCVCPVGQAGSGTQPRLRFYHPGPAGLYQKPEDSAQRHGGVQGHQPESHEAAAPWRVSGYLQLLPLYEGRTVCGYAAGSGGGSPCDLAADRSPAAGPGPSHFVERAGDELLEVLYFSGGVKRKRNAYETDCLEGKRAPGLYE